MRRICENILQFGRRGALRTSNVGTVTQFSLLLTPYLFVQARRLLSMSEIGPPLDYYVSHVIGVIYYDPVSFDKYIATLENIF